LSWISSLVLFFCTTYVVLNLDWLWAVFGVTALSLYVLPIVSTKDPFRVVPWEMSLLLSSPIILHISEQSRTLSDNLLWWDDLASLAFAFSLSTIGFLITVELQMYTTVRMNRAFSVFFVFMFTLSVSGFWHLGEFLSDTFSDSTNLVSNEALMKGLLWAMIGGLLMGFVYYLYIGAMSKSRRESLGLMHLWEVGRWRSD